MKRAAYPAMIYLLWQGLSRHHDPVDTILSHHGLPGPWQELPATGTANRIYAPDDFVLRVAVEGSEALNDSKDSGEGYPRPGFSADNTNLRARPQFL